MDKIAIFSGRFDPPNLGHIITTGWVLRQYGRVIVPILDYPDRQGCSVSVALDIFKTHLHLWVPLNEHYRINYIVNNTHFGKITEDEIRVICWNCTQLSDMSKFEYVGGNKEVNEHIKSLNFIDVRYIPRIRLEGLVPDQYLFESTRIRDKIKKGESLENQYNIDIC